MIDTESDEPAGRVIVPGAGGGGPDGDFSPRPKIRRTLRVIKFPPEPRSAEAGFDGVAAVDFVAVGVAVVVAGSAAGFSVPGGKAAT
jgi:hypothetical protein